MNEQPEPIVVPASLAGERLDRAVALLTGWSRRETHDLVAGGSVLLGGRAVSGSHRLAAGDVIELLAEPAPDAPPSPEALPIDVRHEDDDVIVIAKPAGMVVHPGAGNEHGTLVSALLYRFPEIADVGDAARPGIVHRLDRDTSGLLVVARTQRAHTELVRALAAREVERRYVTLVGGVPNAPRGVIDAPIGRSTKRRTRMAVRESGREARTRYEVRDRLEADAYALLECTLETGRTHQIRVHLAAIGHPVVGDAAYGGRPGPLRLSRPFLHAAGLSFVHPVTGTRLSFDEPLPEDLAEVLASLRAADGD